MGRCCIDPQQPNIMVGIRKKLRAAREFWYGEPFAKKDADKGEGALREKRSVRFSEPLPEAPRPSRADDTAYGRPLQRRSFPRLGEAGPSNYRVSPAPRLAERSAFEAREEVGRFEAWAAFPGAMSSQGPGLRAVRSQGALPLLDMPSRGGKFIEGLPPRDSPMTETPPARVFTFPVPVLATRRAPPQVTIDYKPAGAARAPAPHGPVEMSSALPDSRIPEPAAKIPTTVPPDASRRWFLDPVNGLYKRACALIEDKPQEVYKIATRKGGPLLDVQRQPAGLMPPRRRGETNKPGELVPFHAFGAESFAEAHDAPQMRAESTLRARSSLPAIAEYRQSTPSGDGRASRGSGAAERALSRAPVRVSSPLSRPLWSPADGDVRAPSRLGSAEMLTPKVSALMTLPSAKLHQRVSSRDVGAAAECGGAEKPTPPSSVATSPLPARYRPRLGSDAPGAASFVAGVEIRAPRPSASMPCLASRQQAWTPSPQYHALSTPAHAPNDRLRMLQGLCQKFEQGMHQAPSTLAAELYLCVTRRRELESEEKRLRQRAALVRAEGSQGRCWDLLDAGFAQLGERIAELEVDVAEAEERLQLVPAGLERCAARTSMLTRPATLGKAADMADWPLPASPKHELA
ncbi:hypothetical protein LTR53_003159 [Teratosphaeriaceae sp. CCFEE 6253]|nr:hypothetical protein LTR53_003159 [Teratosphaeriaceae sp. CCFEE 6253]